MKRALTMTTALLSAMSLSAFAGDKYDEDHINMDKYKENTEKSAQAHEAKHGQGEYKQADAYKGTREKDAQQQRAETAAETTAGSDEPTGFVNNNSLHRDVDEEQIEMHSFSDYDLDDNGEIDKNEIFTVDRDRQRFGGVEFDELDSNDDEVVSAEEWNNHFQSSASAS